MQGGRLAKYAVLAGLRAEATRSSVSGVLIAEEFLLLCLDDETGRRSIAGEKIDPALGGALLVELALMERISVTGDEVGWLKRGRVGIISTKPTDDPVLDDALTYLVAKEGKRISDAISPMTWRPMTKNLRQRLLERMIQARLLRPADDPVLGMFPRTSYLPTDPAVEGEIRARLRSALVDGLTPTERTVALVGLLHATGHLARALPGEDRKLVRQRAKAMAEGDWAAKAVKQVIDAVQSSAATGGGGGGDGGGAG